MKFLNKKKKNIQLSGFTLFELLVTITVMMVITTIFVINYRINSNSFNRKQGVSEFIALANEAVSRVTGSYLNDLNGNYNGWGIVVTSNVNYSLFRCTYTTPTTFNVCKFDSNEIEITKTLPEGLEFQKVATGLILYGETSLEFSFTYWPEYYFLQTFDEGNYVSYGYTYTPNNKTSQGVYMDLLLPTYSKYEAGEDGNGVRTGLPHADFFIEDTVSGAMYQIRMHRGGLVEELPEAEDTSEE